MSILEIVTFRPSSPGRLNGMDGQIIDGYQTLMDTISPHGMYLIQQLWHGGSFSQPADGRPPWSRDPHGARLSALAVPFSTN